MRKIQFLFPFIFLTHDAFAIIRTEIEPVVGYERVQRYIPTPHSKDRITYGVKVTAGLLMLSAEALYLHAIDTENFPTLSYSSKDISDKVQLGIRGKIKLLKVLSAYGRAGGQATKNRHEQTLNGVTTVDNEVIKYHPYAGGGLLFSLGHYFIFDASCTVVFKKFPDMNQNDYQATAGFGIKFP